LMLTAILAPEIVVFFAARQFMFAPGITADLAIESQNNQRISKTHGFFFALGGFVSHGGYTTLSQIRGESDIALAYFRDISSVNEEDIKDKSKGDALSKGLALLQVLWFITQSIARQIQQLPVTTLEIATIAFAALNIFIRILWWNKPLGVDGPLIIGPHDIVAPGTSLSDI
ncbi:hypothetical protein C8J56DRAFT_811135, partial [Mycena floridula]